MIPAGGSACEVGLDPHARRFLRLLAATGGASDALDIAGRRKSLEDLAVLAGGAPVPVTDVDDLFLPGPGGALKVRRYVGAAVQREPAPCMIYLHGGGWCAGSLDTHDGVCRTLALAGGFTIFAVEYRLAPEHPFPAGLEDALNVVERVVERASELGVDAGRLVLAGDSAGGGLAAAAAVALRDKGGPKVALQLLICPILDLAEMRASRIAFGDGFFLRADVFRRDVADYLRSGVSPADPRVSPLHTADLDGLPPAHVHVAAFDPFRDEGLAYAHRLVRAGSDVRAHVHPGMIHYFYALPTLIPYAAPAVAEMARAARGAIG